MALETVSMARAIVTVAQALFPGSQVTPQLAGAVAKSVMAWISVPVNVTVQGVTAGSAGSGSVNGKMKFSATPNVVSQALTEAGLVGPSAPGIGLSVGGGVLSALLSSQYSGSSIGVGTGGDLSKVTISNSATLIPIMSGNLAAVQVAGISSPQLGLGLAKGIARLIFTGTGSGGVVGSASPTAASGTSVSVVF